MILTIINVLLLIFLTQKKGCAVVVFDTYTRTSCVFVLCGHAIVES